MAQTTILTAGTTAATSSDVTVAAGANAVISPFVASGVLPASVELAIYMVTPGADVFVAELNNRPEVVTNPTATAIVYRVRRPDMSAYGVGVGVVAIT